MSNRNRKGNKKSGGKNQPPKNSRSATPRSTGFPVQLLPAFRDAIRFYFGAWLPISIAGAVTLGVSAAFGVWAGQATDGVRSLQWLAINLVGSIAAGAIAVPWYRFALDAVDGNTIELRSVLDKPKMFFYQAVASFWFWAGVLLGLSYLRGIPSIFIALLYAFHGYVIADEKARSGLLALGHSVRLTEGKRIGLFAIMALLAFFNFCGAIAVGFGVNPLTIFLAYAGVVVTTSITVVFGAILYREFEKDLK